MEQDIIDLAEKLCDEIRQSAQAGFCADGEVITKTRELHDKIKRYRAEEGKGPWE